VDGQEVADGNWVMLGAGASRIATVVTRLAGSSSPVAFAVLLGS
jgi:hypothetical protein